MKLVRVSLRVPEDQAQELRRWAAIENVSMAEVLRRSWRLFHTIKQAGQLGYNVYLRNESSKREKEVINI